MDGAHPMHRRGPWNPALEVFLPLGMRRHPSERTSIFPKHWLFQVLLQTLAFEIDFSTFMFLLNVLMCTTQEYF